MLAKNENKFEERPREENNKQIHAVPILVHFGLFFFSHFFFSFLFALVPHKSSSAMICEWGYFMRCILLCCLENQFVVLGSEGMQRIIGERWTRTRDAKKKHNKIVLYISEQE